ncbi:hypothetical protein [Streptomyces sp. H39-S7]|nr:hypothetical protein [Streptomyces sp. H39-S7]MCZ4125938.1 hypothetical protein [Streptomyces sp. H39-S7]
MDSRTTLAVHWEHDRRSDEQRITGRPRRSGRPLTPLAGIQAMSRYPT